MSVYVNEQCVGLVFLHVTCTLQIYPFIFSIYSSFCVIWQTFASSKAFVKKLQYFWLFVFPKHHNSMKQWFSSVNGDICCYLGLFILIGQINQYFLLLTTFRSNAVVRWSGSPKHIFIQARLTPSCISSLLLMKMNSDDFIILKSAWNKNWPYLLC